MELWFEGLEGGKQQLEFWIFEFSERVGGLLYGT